MNIVGRHAYRVAGLPAGAVSELSGYRLAEDLRRYRPGLEIRRDGPGAIRLAGYALRYLAENRAPGDEGFIDDAGLHAAGAVHAITDVSGPQQPLADAIAEALDGNLEREGIRGFESGFQVTARMNDVLVTYAASGTGEAVMEREALARWAAALQAAGRPLAVTVGRGFLSVSAPPQSGTPLPAAARPRRNTGRRPSTAVSPHRTPGQR